MQEHPLRQNVWATERAVVHVDMTICAVYVRPIEVQPPQVEAGHGLQMVIKVEVLQDLDGLTKTRVLRQITERDLGRIRHRRVAGPGRFHPQLAQAVIDAVRQTIPCVILDLPHGWQPWIKSSLLAADDVVIVATPDLTSLRNAKNIIDLVKSARPNDAPPRLVINQVGVPKRPEIATKDFAETMGIDPAAIIAFDPALFGQAANNGQMVIELAPKAPVSEALRQLCRAITGRTMQGAVSRNSVSIFSFLKGKKQA